MYPQRELSAGEIGVLTQVAYYPRFPLRCHLTIEHEGENFIGTVLFDDPTICRFIVKILKSQIGHSIKDIAGMDISYSL